MRSVSAPWEEQGACHQENPFVLMDYELSRGGLKRRVATKRFSLKRDETISARQLELTHLAPEGGAAHAEGGGGLVAPPVVGLQSGAQALALVGRRLRLALGRLPLHDLGGEVLGVDRLAAADRHGVLQGVLELPHVARP